MTIYFWSEILQATGGGSSYVSCTCAGATHMTAGQDRPIILRLAFQRRYKTLEVSSWIDVELRCLHD